MRAPQDEDELARPYAENKLARPHAEDKLARPHAEEHRSAKIDRDASTTFRALRCVSKHEGELEPLSGG